MDNGQNNSNEARQPLGRWVFALIGAAAVLAGGSLSSLIGGSPGLYAELDIPASPPSFVFPVVWTVLYILIGAAAGWIFATRDAATADDRRRGLVLFGAMLVFNYLWYPLFFGAQAFSLALIDLVVIIVLSVFAASYFFRLCRLCGWALVLYIAWLLYALWLNFAAVFLI